MTWNEILQNEVTQSYYINELAPFLREEYEKYECYPEKDKIFNAFYNTPSFDATRVVILGQDPYHEPGQAQGLSFSVPNDVKRPPSLVNIVKELESEYGTEYPETNDLTYLAEQGVLLLNTTLTVRKGSAGSHFGHGWETFTDNIIKILGEREEPMVFLLWGKHAQSKKKLITSKNALVLTTSHPSPFSFKRGFEGCGHFVKCNDFLVANELKPINWFPVANKAIEEPTPINDNDFVDNIEDYYESYCDIEPEQNICYNPNLSCQPQVVQAQSQVIYGNPLLDPDPIADAIYGQIMAVEYNYDNGGLM